VIEAVVQQLGSSKPGAPGAAPRVQLVGLKGAARALAVAEWLVREKRPALVVLPTDKAADAFHRDLAFFLGVDDTDAPAASGKHADLVRYGEDDFHPYEAASPDPDAAAGRVEALYRLAHPDRPVAVIASARALARRTVPMKALERAVELIQVNEDLDRDAFLVRLAAAGYARVSVVEDRGTFAVRGAILDVWPPLQVRPIRIEMFGDTVESIRSFDVSSQRGRDPVHEAVILPVREVFFGADQIAAAKKMLEPFASPRAAESLAAIERRFAFSGIEALIPWLFDGVLETAIDYLPPRAGIFRIDPLEIERELATLTLEAQLGAEKALHENRAVPAANLLYADAKTLFDRGTHPQVDLSDVEMAGSPAIRVAMAATSIIRQDIAAAGTEKMLEPLALRLKRLQGERTKAVFVCHAPSQAERLLFLLSKYRVNMQLFEDRQAGALLVEPKSALRQATEEVTVLLGDISAGFESSDWGLAVISEADVFGERGGRRRKAKAFADAKAIQAISDLKSGDLVVHKDYGIAIFKSIVRVESTAPTREKLAWLPGSGSGPPPPPVDFVWLEYLGGDKLYVPVYKMNLVQKYTVGEGESVTLDKLGGTGWESRKKKVSAAVARMAKELLDLYARRAVAARPAFGVHPEVAQFEAQFEHDETEDQLAAIESVHADLSSPKPMDRLVCGDVGFGKTEVALRAAARVALDGKQVAVLVPTTILAQQHARTFARRFKDTPVRVETLSRFVDPVASKKVILDLGEGKVDVLVGTHRLLGKEVKFKDLGLVIIDEEHRFGVKQKEKLKELRSNVDVLALSATPIPRTLHMSMSGLRDLSLIETPPEDRLPVRTFVTRIDGGTVREAIVREMQRGGQVYVVHNRIQNIGGVASWVQKCVPEARIAIGHGQMNADDLEKVMVDFVDKRYDVLVSTAIVESGLDIPSANTMIINRADRFGLAQLYQLRGRVGRSALKAFCYLLIPPGDGAVTADALERLSAMQEYSELGSGFRVAQRDLEIRGAGNLLGENQSGFINAVGFDLYLSMLKKAIDELKGQEPSEPELEPEINLKIAALIPETYITDPRFRVGFYRRLSAARDEAEIAGVRDELRDRFGVPPPDVENLVEILKLRRTLQRLGISDMGFDGKDLVLTFAPKTKVNPERLVRMVAKEPKKYRLTPDDRFRSRVVDRVTVVQDAKTLLALLS